MGKVSVKMENSIKYHSLPEEHRTNDFDVMCVHAFMESKEQKQCIETLRKYWNRIVGLRSYIHRH